jgi:hypothetical protein
MSLHFIEEAWRINVVCQILTEILSQSECCFVNDQHSKKIFLSEDKGGAPGAPPLDPLLCRRALEHDEPAF